MAREIAVAIEPFATYEAIWAKKSVFDAILAEEFDGLGGSQISTVASSRYLANLLWAS